MKRLARRLAGGAAGVMVALVVVSIASTGYRCRCTDTHTCPGCEAAIDAAEARRDDRSTMGAADWDRYEAGPGWHGFPGQPGGTS